MADCQTGGVYSDQQIRAAIKAGRIVFHPFNDDQISASSVDVTLGQHYFRTERQVGNSFYNPFSKDDVDRYFDGPWQAVTHQTWVKDNGRQLFTGIPADWPIIVLGPGERILAHTHEFIGIRPPGTSTMQARSTWGRNGITVCLDAGWGDPGYINRWTMEVYNLNREHSVALPIGERIAQIVFHQTGPVDQSYQQKEAKYQTKETDLDQLVKTWIPEQMIPKAYLDKRSQPGEL